MQSVQSVEQNTIFEVFAAHLALIGTDIQAWSDLLAEDAVVEFPYASALGASDRFEGKSAIINYMKTAVTHMQNWVFTNVRKYQTSDPNVLFAEFRGEAVFAATGHPYQQDYVARLEIKDGKIVHYREYWNPVVILNETGSAETFRQVSNVE
jgi:uncharacterized protein